MLIGDVSKHYLKLVNAKAKMYEYFIPKEQHIAVNEEVNKLFINTIAILGDYCVAVIDELLEEVEALKEELNLSSRFFEEYVNARLNRDIDDYLRLIASAAYYLIGKNGDSFVVLKDIKWSKNIGANGLEYLLFSILTNNYCIDMKEIEQQSNYTFVLNYILGWNRFFNTGDYEFYKSVIEHRKYIYKYGNTRELFLIDIIVAITKIKVNNSTVKCLPKYTGLSFESWKSIINSELFIKELWYSQIKLGEAGVFNGRSGVIQMPTGAGKTKSIEIILRAAFMQKRTDFAIIVAPFRALCREITMDLKKSFGNDSNILVNELSDVLTIEYLKNEEYAKKVVIVTPEKLMYLTKQFPEMVKEVGVIVFDEAHLFDDFHRGVSYELLATIIKRNIKNDAQKILISAIIPNAENINQWFNGEDGVVITNKENILSNKSVAFTKNTKDSKDKYSLFFLKKDDSYRDDFFVPRVVTRIMLKRKKGERNIRYFPEVKNAKINRDIAISISNRLCKNGGNVIFCGRKDSSRRIVERIIEIADRGYDISNFINSCKKDEVNKIYYQSVKNIGKENIYSIGIEKGIFSHHGNIPDGMKSTVEYAMRREYIRTVICTSTLSQGVNLPIRYLIVPSVYQAGEMISVRDFHNLVGRAGRSGMYTEGTILFTEVEAYNMRNYKWGYYKELLNNDNSKPCESKILDIAKKSEKYKELIRCYLNGSIDEYLKKVEEMLEVNKIDEKDERTLRYEIGSLINILRQVENFLMSNMRVDNTGKLEIFDDLIENTYAYFLATDEQKKFLLELMSLLKDKIINNINDNNKIMIFGKSMLDIEKLLDLEDWINNNIDVIKQISDVIELGKVVFPIVQQLIMTKEFEKLNEVDKLVGIYSEWLKGKSYYEILNYSIENGLQIRSRIKYKDLSIYNIIECCDDLLGYKASLIISAMKDIISGIYFESSKEIIKIFDNLSKRTRYGLASMTQVILYEMGFNDRELVKEISKVIGNSEWEVKRKVVEKLKVNKVEVIEVLKKFPTLYEDIFNKL